MKELELLQRKLDRQIAARKQAESILENKALELFEANKSLNKLNATLESQIKERTRDLERAKILAEEAQKAESIFLASMSHEIRTPLNAIIGMSHLLKDANLNKEEEKYLNVLNSSANILYRLISDVLDISKIESGRLEVVYKSFDLREMINTVLQAFVLKIEEKALNLNVDIDSKINTWVKGDELLLNQILINLIGNAIKFTNQGQLDILVKVLNQNAKTYDLSFQVKDTGIGLSQEEIKNIFDRFKQANVEIRQKYGGTGLGLALTKKIVEILGGEISVESEPTKGSTFTINLQLGKSESSANAADNIPLKTEFNNLNLPVLIVEDNEMNQIYISKLLDKWQIKYDLADNGEQAVHLAEKKDYSLIFMDLQMPILDGHEAVRQIKRISTKNKNTPVIALTASTLSSEKEKAREVGMDKFLFKPFRPEELAKILNDYSTKAMEANGGERKKTGFTFNPKLDVETLENQYDQDYSYYLDMMDIFIKNIPNELSILKEAGEKKDLNTIASVAHKIKPSFTMMGLKYEFGRLHEIELEAKKNESIVFSKVADLVISLQESIMLITKERDKLQRFIK